MPNLWYGSQSYKYNKYLIEVKQSPLIMVY